MVLVVVDVPDALFGSVEGVVEGSGSSGFGQVTSLHSSGQNSRILLKRYHCLVRERPVGANRSGRSVADGAQSSLRSFISTSGESLFSLTKMDPLWLLGNRK